MAVNHLDDQQIQKYLDNALYEDRIEFDTHIKSCTDCQQKLAEYREIYQALGEDPYPALSENFADRVMDKLQVKQKFWLLTNEYLLSSLTISVAIAALMIIMKPWAIITGFMQALYNQFALVISSLAPLLGGKIHLVLGICLILVLIEIIDYKILRPRFRQFH